MFLQLPTVGINDALVGLMKIKSEYSISCEPFQDDKVCRNQFTSNSDANLEFSMVSHPLPPSDVQSGLLLPFLHVNLLPHILTNELDSSTSVQYKTDTDVVMNAGILYAEVTNL